MFNQSPHKPTPTDLALPYQNLLHTGFHPLCHTTDICLVPRPVATLWRGDQQNQLICVMWSLFSAVGWVEPAIHTSSNATRRREGTAAEAMGRELLWQRATHFGQMKTWERNQRHSALLLPVSCASSQHHSVLQNNHKQLEGTNPTYMDNSSAKELVC